MFDEVRYRELEFEIARAYRPLLAPRRFKGARGGRSAGRSHNFGEMLIAECMRRHVRAACVREIQSSLEDSVKAVLESKIHKYALEDVFDIRRREIRGPHDSLIIFRGIQSHTARRIRSLEGFNIGYIEEAQSLSQTSLDDLIPTIRSPGSEIWAAWNPLDPHDPIDVHFRENEGDPDFICVHTTWRDNPWLPDESYRDMERTRARDPDKYAHVWEGQYRTMSEARVFKNWRVEDFETPDDAVFYFGADWGYSIDPSVLIRCFIDGRTLYVDAEAYMVGCEIDYCPFLFGGMQDKQLRELNSVAYLDLVRKNVQWRGIPGARQWPITADSARPETIAYMKRHGFPRMIASIKGKGSLEEGIEFLQSYDIVVHPRCKHVIDELTFYSYKTDPRTGEVIPVLEDKKNHTIDALRYSIERLRRAKRAGTW